jgi:hypothetical protein
MREDLSLQSAEMTALQARYRDVQLLLSEQQSKQLPEQYELARSAHEQKALQAKVQYLETELQRRMTADAELRSSKDTQLFALEAELSEFKASAQSKTNTIGSLKVCSLVYLLSVCLCENEQTDQKKKTVFTLHFFFHYFFSSFHNFLFICVPHSHFRTKFLCRRKRSIR